jgi:excisionase family DNA binding protein
MSKSNPPEIHAPATQGAIHLVMQGKEALAKAWSRPGWLSACLPTQRHHGKVMQPTLDSRAVDSSAADFERVLNTEEAAALLQIHPKTLQRMARQGSVPAFRIGDLWRFRASALDEWLRSGACSKRHSCR